jgi:hypothetical protein
MKISRETFELHGQHWNVKYDIDDKGFTLIAIFNEGGELDYVTKAESDMLEAALLAEEAPTDGR